MAQPPPQRRRAAGRGAQALAGVRHAPRGAPGQRHPRGHRPLQQPERRPQRSPAIEHLRTIGTPPPCFRQYDGGGGQRAAGGGAADQDQQQRQQQEFDGQPGGLGLRVVGLPDPLAREVPQRRRQPADIYPVGPDLAAARGVDGSDQLQVLEQRRRRGTPCRSSAERRTASVPG